MHYDSSHLVYRKIIILNEIRNKVYFPWYVCYSGVIGLQCAYDKELSVS
jgi:hypothetical protein